jgi:uncharacterized protein (DUF4415 family)
MPKLKASHVWASDEEDAAITAAALADPDALPLTDADWAVAKPKARVGRPLSTQALKVPTTIRFDADIVQGLRATGKVWQTRVNDAMREWLRTHSAG